MGQYHRIANHTRKEYICSHGLGCGMKLWEMASSRYAPQTALLLLLAEDNGGGGGDVAPHPLVGSWAGDKIGVHGDYGSSPESQAAWSKEYKDISGDVRDMMTVCLELEYSPTQWGGWDYSEKNIV
jgi:hypothetical protein